jgi:hypothetical protein
VSNTTSDLLVDSMLQHHYVIYTNQNYSFTYRRVAGFHLSKSNGPGLPEPHSPQMSLGLDLEVDVKV